MPKDRKTPDGVRTPIAEAPTLPPPEPQTDVSREWGATGPNGEPPNVRLAHTPAGSLERMIHSNDHGEWWPAREYVKNGRRLELPVLEDGTADVDLQRAGFWHAYAHRIVRSPEYVAIKKG